MTRIAIFFAYVFIGCATGMAGTVLVTDPLVLAVAAIVYVVVYAAAAIAIHRWAFKEFWR